MPLATLARRTALALCAMLVLAAAVVFGGRMDTTTQVKPPAPIVPHTLQATKPIPAVAQDIMAGSSSPVVVSLPVLAPGALELAQLRARALVIPVQQTTAAQLQDTYTQARAGGAPHDALDIMAPRGTPVLAVEDGRVAKLFLSKPGGITIYQFDLAGDYAYYYAHLDRYADGLAEGASLHKGQVIGYVGSTGNASPDAPHLHFAIFRLGPERQWWRGTPLNPYLVWRGPSP